MKHLVLAVVLLASVSVAGAGDTGTVRPLPVPNDPLEIFAWRSDLIVVGNVISTAEPKLMDVRVPGRAEAVRAPFIRHSFNVGMVVKDSAAEPLPHPQPWRLGIVVPIPIRDNSGFSAQTVKEMAAALAPMQVLLQPELKPDAMFVVFLQRATAAGDYLPIRILPFTQRGDDSAARQAADLDLWPWGKPVDGLQLALFMRKPVWRAQEQNAFRVLAPGESVPAAKPQKIVQPCFYAALRNVSDHPLAIDLYPDDMSLAFGATGKDGQRVDAFFYNWKKRVAPPPFAATDTQLLAPKQVLFLGPYGKSDTVQSAAMELAPGAWTFQAAYKVGRDAKGVSDLPLWKGEALSAPLEASVQDQGLLLNHVPAMNQARPSPSHAP